MMETPIVIGGILLFGGVGLLIYLFIISNMKESELMKKLSLTSMLKVIGGPVMFMCLRIFCLRDTGLNCGIYFSFRY
ncbi:MAG TPA: hypothetical protein QGF86_08085 [Nitrospinaceae bacterium]|nr:hypothetical protein [Nitrospinaceae bacterium]